MAIKITNIDDIKKISKPWGYEKWIADGSPDFNYALKEIFFQTGYKSSIQFHEFKQETSYVQNGRGILHYSTDSIDIKKFNDGGYTKNEINNFIKNLHKKEIGAGDIYHIKPGYIHQVESIENLTVIESSTVELNDVFRLNDEWGRKDGKIDYEQQNILPSTNELYREKTVQYKFVNNFARKKVLDVTYGSALQYFSAKSFLNSGVKEVWSFDTYTKNSYSIRTRKNKLINFEKTSNLDNSKFDTIFLCNTLQYENNVQDALEEFKKLLSFDGTLVVSAFNNEFSYEDNYDNKGFSYNELLETLQDSFKNIEIFSQKSHDILSSPRKPSIISTHKIRHEMANLFLKIDKTSTFYKKHLQNPIKKIDESLSKIPSIEDLKPTVYEMGDNPLFFIAVCTTS